MQFLLKLHEQRHAADGLAREVHDQPGGLAAGGRLQDVVAGPPGGTPCKGVVAGPLSVWKLSTSTGVAPPLHAAHLADLKILVTRRNGPIQCENARLLDGVDRCQVHREPLGQ